MQEQSCEHHVRYVPTFHFLQFFLTLGVFVVSVINLLSFLLHSHGANWYAPVLFFTMSIIMVLHFFHTRKFATKLQDRIIRTEENLRYFTLTGKLLSPELTMPQIIALRFAPDEEFIVLVPEAITQKLSLEAIKQKIKAWKADHHRV